MSTKFFATLLIISSLSLGSMAQIGMGSITGSLETNNSFYVRDTAIGASNTPLYDNLKSGTDAWLSLDYQNTDIGLRAGVRMDVFNNSILFNPTGQYTGAGLGRWYITKEIGDLTLTGGYIYDQIGTGAAFRAYEERGLGIDNALFGVKIDYQVNDELSLKGFTGQQKNRFERYAPIIKGLAAEYAHASDNGLNNTTGVALVNRTMDQESMNAVVANINALPLADRFVPKFNTYTYAVYNQLDFGNWGWQIEYTGKTAEALLDNDTLRELAGSNFYTNLSYSQKGLGISGAYKRTENFDFRTSPNQTLNDGLVGFLPPLARQNTYRLLARYNAATQLMGEQAVMANVIYTPKKGYTINLNASNITDLDNELLFRELYGDVEMKLSKKLKLTPGVQVLSYNQEVYEVKPGVDMVEAITPFLAAKYKLTRKNSLKAELSYQLTEQDFGDWLWAQVELNMAPSWSFSIADMYNIDPNPKKNPEDIHYYALSTTYRKKASKFTLSYTKQVEGVVCTGGVCRYEPAFSGVKFSVNTSF